MRFLSPFPLSSTTTDTLPNYTESAEVALLLFQTSPLWKTSTSPTHVYLKTLLRYHLASRSTGQVQRLGNACTHICVFLGAHPAGLFFTRHIPALLVKYEKLSDYHDLVTRIIYPNWTAWCYLCSNTAVLVLHRGWVHGIVNCDKNPALFMSLSVTQYAHSTL